MVEKAAARLRIAVDDEENLLNLVEAHAHAKLPPDARLVKSATLPVGARTRRLRARHARLIIGAR
jgi:hypothetical protein